MWRNEHVHEDPPPPHLPVLCMSRPLLQGTLCSLSSVFTALAVSSAEDATSTTVDEALSFWKTAHGGQGPCALSCQRCASAHQITDVLMQRSESPPAHLAQLTTEEPAREAVIQGDGAGEAVRAKGHPIHLPLTSQPHMCPPRDGR